MKPDIKRKGLKIPDNNNQKHESTKNRLMVLKGYTSPPKYFLQSDEILEPNK